MIPPRPLPTLLLTLGLAAWRGPVYAYAGYDVLGVLGGLRPSDLAVRLGLRL